MPGLIRNVPPITEVDTDGSHLAMFTTVPIRSGPGPETRLGGTRA